jgi:hypothetical protein
VGAGSSDSGLRARASPAQATLMGALGSARDRPEARDGTMSTSRGGASGRARREQHRVQWSACGRWLRQQMRSGTDGWPHGAVKRATG